MLKPNNIGECVIVLGSGIAGLISARILSTYFSEVLLFDRDEIPTLPHVRKGIPQGNHFHALLPGGLEIISELFPNILNELTDAGSLLAQPGDFYFYYPQGKSYLISPFQPEPIFDKSIKPSYVQTRALLELCIRRRVEAIKNVRTYYETKVSRPYVVNDEIQGIFIDDTEQLMHADLVVDATGKKPRTLTWLKQLNFHTPEESTVNCDFAYTSVFLQPEDHKAFEGVGFFIFADPNSEYPHRGGSLVRIEQSMWQASVSGSHGDYPPNNYEEVLEYSKTLKNPILYDLLKQAEPISDPAHFRVPRSTRRHFEKLNYFPNGLLPIGDAICHFNPLWGQGMSSACRQAKALGRVLQSRLTKQQGLNNIALDFFQEAYEETRAPWLYAALADFNNPLCTGDFPFEERESINIIKELNKASEENDSNASALLASIAQLQKPLAALQPEVNYPKVRTEA